VNLCEVVESVLSVFEGRIANAQVQVRREYGRREDGQKQCFLEANDGELRQVLANLIGNAIDATPAGGNIRIRVADCPWLGNDTKVRFTIADNGSGIRSNFLPRIFEPFFTTKTETGTGLGLWITREILLKHGGNIRVRSSQVPGRSGTVFTILLPMKFADAA
jgi:signal transduction histidine kinase